MAKSERSKKSKVLTSVAAVVLAVSMIIGGGTYAYLEAESDDVVNKFNTEQVTVALDETGDKEYDIIPGTSEDKDPKVTVTNSVDAYVYVTVEDTTQGLVDYEIADGWLPLDGYENVYYREVAAGEEPQEFYVLKDNKVSYDAALENKDMEGKEDLKLTFKAYAIQKAPFNEPVAAWEGKDSVVATSQEEITSAISENKPVVLAKDLTVSGNLAESVPENGSAVINLNNNTITFDSTQGFENGKSLEIENGTVVTPAGATNAFEIANDGDVTIKNTTVTSNVNNGNATFYIADEGSTLNIVDSVVNQVGNGFIVSTNAEKEGIHRGVTINIKNSELNVSHTDGWSNVGVLLNVPGNLNIENSTITGEVAAVAVRGGTAVIKDSVLSRPYTVDGADETTRFMNSDWGTGNGLPISTLLIGNRGGAYQYPSDVTLVNTDITAVSGKTVYMYGNTGEGLGATLTYDAASKFTAEGYDNPIVVGNEYCTINGEAAIPNA